ncbi:TetR/AcrR family transcriptional regulator [Bifidobacterium oedipodis]|uniref:TetR family transcriptional regulator n=1 Tax=Bifidobacterium oedipodis TaxID=2675322 RepID=A0A7Y0EN24_9BIFI|nr:TetR/AcrR family transcriptional regulator [Bifidobacterium sp. DSM 109957]NMM93187.1 TetR family transcriptional regulator [Bifidobacterium sp. DSM 109957]
MDLRTRYTLDAIDKAFFQLLRKQPLETITVSQICKLAQINRSTFYRYYGGAHDLVEHCIDDVLDSVRGDLQSNADDMRACFCLIFTTLHKHRDLFALLREQGALRDLSAYFFRYFSTLSEQNHSTLRHYFLYYGFVGVFRYWLERGMMESPEEIAAEAYDLYRKLSS